VSQDSKSEKPNLVAILRASSVYLSDVDVDSCLAVVVLMPVLVALAVPAEVVDLAMKPSPILDKRDGGVGDVAEDIPK